MKVSQTKTFRYMTINEIIEKYHEKLFSMVKRRDVVVSLNQTSEDVYQNVIVTAIKKYRDTDIDEMEGYRYLEKSLKAELHYQYNKISTIEVSLDDMECPPEIPLFE